jgi:sigma-B regulation protein RsbU (phosphoserine phosphatase)
MRQQARNFSLLHEVTRELTSILDRRELVHRVAILVRRLIDYDLFSVLLWNEQTQLLDPWVAFSKDGPRTGEKVPMPLGYGLSGTAAALRQPVRVPNVQLDPRYVRLQDDLEVASELDIPLVFKDRLIGVLNLESTRFNAFTNQHQQLLSTLGSSVAIALENARLYEQLQRDERKLETDLSTAREMQKQLLPKSTPWVPGLQIAVGYEPALHLAGDFYDFLPYGQDRVAIAVGDVAGKATSAALFGTLAIGMLREYAAESRVGPSKLLAEMNRKLRKLGFDNRFLAMLFAVYDKTTRRVTMANSGLPYPFVVRGRQVHRIDIGGVPLGLFEGQSYEETEIGLADGDALLIASDGLEESLNESSEEFGPKGVEATLRRLAPGTAQEISHGLLQAARHHSGSGAASDDRTIVVLKAIAS